MPNRLYAVTGRAAGSRDNASPSLYDIKSFVRHLDNARVSWKWFSHDDFPLLWAIDRSYALTHPRIPAYFDREPLGFAGEKSFVRRAAAGELPSVSWIDPNFVDVKYGPARSNDDHPPSDLRAGQELVFKLFNAVVRSPQWPKTLLVITYDEHGGFFDHVAPPPVSDHPLYKTLGLRVPMLLVGPRVKNFVCHEFEDEEPWEHTALIRTIFHAFADDPQAAIDAMAAAGAPRVKDRKAHLGYVLEDKPRKGIDPPEAAAAEIEAWRAKARQDRLAVGPEQPSIAPDGAGQPLVLTDFQDEWTQFAIAMRSAGLPPGP
jgi:phospholipase C